MKATKVLPFTLEEYQRRIEGVQAEMRRRKIDLMLATTMSTVCYLTGIESVSPHKFWLVVVPQEGSPEFLCQDFESHNALLSSWLNPRFFYGVSGDPVTATAAMLKELGWDGGRIGTEQFNYTSMSIGDYLRLREQLPGAQLVDASECVARVMSIKSPPEVEYLREAGRITGEAMQAMIDATRAGAIDNQIAAVAYDVMTRHGSEYASYPVIVTTGARSGVPHSTYKRVTIARGDPVFMEIAACVHRYQTPMMRVAIPGKPTDQERWMAEAAIASVDAMVRNIRPGATANEVATKSAECLKNPPVPIVWHGYYGYSVGLGFPPEWSDCPWLLIRVGSDEVLRPGMVFHCSTSLRDPGVCGATCSETILVTEDGCEVLTPGRRELLLR